MTSAIARMNLFLHGIEDFQIVRGDTLVRPEVRRGRPAAPVRRRASPIRRTRSSSGTATLLAADPWGRNIYGTPPQGRADYAFWQHILASLNPETGRCAILFPHGVLFRDEEREMRRKLVEADVIECVLGLGPNLFYNSPMEACVVICRTQKPAERAGQGAVHQRRQRSDPRAGAELPHAERTSSRSSRPTARSRTCEGFAARRHARRDRRQRRQPEHPALRRRRTATDARRDADDLEEAIDAVAQSSSAELREAVHELFDPADSAV